MKILLVNDYATPTGGEEIMVLALREQLRRRGHDARLFASAARPGNARSAADYEAFGTTLPFRTLVQTVNPSAFRQLRRVLAEFQPDVVDVRVFLTQLSPLILPLLQHVPSLHHVTWYRTICPLGTKTLPNGAACHAPAGAVCYHAGCLTLPYWLPLMVQTQLWRRWQQVFKLIVANSEATKARLLAEGIAPVEVVWNGVPLRPSRPPLTQPPTVGFAGRLVQQKGVDILVRAFAVVARRLPEARLLIAGDGPQRKFLQDLIARLHLSSQVVLLGHISQADMERAFVGVWVQAVPSRWAEAFGLVAAEAMMRGTAVVASACDGLKEIVQNGQTGFLVPPGDSDALAEALLHLLQDRSLAEHLGRAGREVAVARFSETTYVDTFVRLYQRVRTGEVSL